MPLAYVRFFTFFLCTIAYVAEQPSLLAARQSVDATAATTHARTFSLAQQPLAFVENRGQWSTPAQFIAHKGPLAAALERGRITLRFVGESVTSMTLTFEDASPQVNLLGEQQHETSYNYYVGNDRSRWRTQVPSYQSVLYRGLYAGVDLRVREQAGMLEYDVLLSPRADLNHVVIRAEGVTQLDLAEDGALLLKTAHGTLRQTPPRTWEVLPSGARREVQAQFRIVDSQRYGFVVPTRDTKLALVIDPGLDWSTFLGGNSEDWVKGVDVARDGSGDILVTGTTASTDFPQANFPAGTQKVYVARFNASGNILRYVTFLAGSAATSTYVGRLATHTSGDVVVLGNTGDAAFPVTTGAYQTTLRGPTDVYLVRLDSAGVLTASTLLGGTGDEGAAFTSRGVAFDASGAVVVTGVTLSSDFPTTVGAYDRTFNPTSAFATDTFFARLSPNLNQLTYSTFFAVGAWVRDLIVDPQGYVTVTGIVGAGLPTTADALDRVWNNGVTGVNGEDGFVSRFKFDSAGSADLKYSTYLGGHNRDHAFGLAFDPSDPQLVTVVGSTWQDLLLGIDFPVTPGSFKPTIPPNFAISPLFPHVQNGFVSRFRFPPTGTPLLVWSSFIGGSFYDHATDVTVDNAGNVMVIGGSRSFDFPTTRGAFDRTLGGQNYDCFVARISADGSQLAYATFLGGNGGSGIEVTECDFPTTTDESHIVAVDVNSAVVVGETTSPDFPTTPGTVDPVYTPGPVGFAPANDVFVARMTLTPDASGDLTVSAPTLVSPANGAAMPGVSNVTFTWNAVADPSGIEGYNYQVSSRPDFPDAFIQYRGSVSTNSLTLSSIAIITWYWRIQAADRAGNLSAWSQPFTLHLGTASPPTTAPSLVSPANGANVAQPVTFDWSDVSGATSYEIQIDNSSTIAEPFVASQTVTASQVSLGGLPVQQLWWRVRALNSGGAGPFSATRSFTPQAAAVTLSTISLNPTSVVGGNSSTGTATLSGAAPRGGAVVTLSDNSSAATVPASVTVPAGATSATFTVTTTTVTSNTTATITGSYGGTSRTAMLTITPASGGTLPAPTLVSPANDARFSAGQTINFDWSDVAGAASYTIEIDDSSTIAAPLVTTQTVTASQVSISGLPTRRMWWRVRANNASGVGGTWSTVRRFELR